MKRIAFAAAIALVAATACAQTGAPPPAAAAPAAITELVKKDSKIGEGPLVDGKAVLVSYTGWLYDPKAPDQKGEKFDTSEGRATPFGFIVGRGRGFKGWDEGLPGMREGGKRTLIVPPELGTKGPGDKSPPNATLLWEIEVIKVLN